MSQDSSRATEFSDRLNETAIIGMSVMAAIIYGIIHDQITVRVCLEYFTVFHDLPFENRSPTVIALYMGVLATWWVGLPLGIGLMLAARVGSLPKRSAVSLIRPLIVLLIGMGIAAACAGFAGYRLTRLERASPPGEFARIIPEELHAPFVADFWAHNASYAGGILGGMGLILYVLASRYRMHVHARNVHRRP